jgi:DNA mismatch repair protein MutS
LSRTPHKDKNTAGSSSETPMMAQYQQAKKAHPDAILLFRMGDFYETFFEDAHVLSRVTGVTLTSRNSADANPIPLAGFPWHNSEPYVARLLQAGHRVAICEQVEEPGAGKKLLERRVIEVLSPGTALGESLLQAGNNNYLASVRREGERFGLAVADISTGEFFWGDLTEDQAREELQRVAPAELLAAEGDRAAVDGLLRDSAMPPFRTLLDSWKFSNDRARQHLCDQFRVATLDAFEVDAVGPGLGAAGALLEYAREQKQSDLGHLRPPLRLHPEDGLLLDESTLRSLEVIEPLPGGSAESTLLHVLDQTVTAAGARRLRSALLRPLTDAAVIEARQDGIEALLEARARGGLRQLLKGTSDVERILGKLHCNRAQPRDLAALRQTLREAPRIAAQISALGVAAPYAGAGPVAPSLPNPAAAIPADLAERLEAALVDQPPALLSESGVFRDAWDMELSELRSLARDAKGWIARLQEEERIKTGIPGLKVGFNRVFGYYIEVSQSQLPKVPDRYQRKQTLVGAERFLTPELKEFEQKVLHAEEGETRRERVLFEALCQEVRGQTETLQVLARSLAALDFIQSLAEAAARGRWVRPRLSDEARLTIRDGRHPVVEQVLPAGAFIANDTELDVADRQVSILTGPNMAGKSTYLRQVGLITVMAQLGSFVPAREAEVGLCDRVFTRVGAHDSLAKGQSTFLVEMIETSKILHHATGRGLVLLDEVGRGTSTYDGLAIAWAVAEALESKQGARPRTIFATHFHELTRLARPGRGFVNLCVEVKEWGDRVVFLRRVIEGVTDRSYGIHVAQLAGVPEIVVRRARSILEGLEREARRIRPTLESGGKTGGGDASAATGFSSTDAVPDGPAGSSEESQGREAVQLSLFSASAPHFLEELRSLRLDQITPLEALTRLHRWQEELLESGHEVG